MKLASLLLLSVGGLLAACSEGVDYSSRTAPVGACGDVETHVVGIYDSKGEVVEINIDRPGNHNLVVSAHASTKWRISTSNGARLLKVYAVGYEEQMVALPAGTELVKDSKDTTGTYACGFAEGDHNGCDSDQLLSLASKVIHHVSSFHGCTSATSWKIGQDLGTSSDCAAQTQYDSLAGCIAYMNGENTCGNTPGDGSGSGSGGDNGSGSGQDEGGAGQPGPVFL